MQVRVEQQADQPAVLDLQREAFGADGEAALVERLVRENVERISLVAETDAALVGHVLFSEAQLLSESAVTRIGALGPVGVLPVQQRRGTGAALIRRGLELCWQRGWRAVIVAGDPAYYGRFGFERADVWSIRCEFAVPAESIHDRVCRRGDPRAGAREYHPAFAEV